MLGLDKLHTTMATALGLATMLMLLIVSSSVAAQPVFDSKRVTAGGVPQLFRTFDIPKRHVLVLTGYAKASTHATGPSTAWIAMVVTDKTAGTDATEHCAHDRMSTPKPGITSLKLHSSASCILVLCPGKFQIKAEHGVQHASRRTLQMDYVLIEHPMETEQDRKDCERSRINP